MNECNHIYPGFSDTKLVALLHISLVWCDTNAINHTLISMCALRGQSSVWAVTAAAMDACIWRSGCTGNVRSLVALIWGTHNYCYINCSAVRSGSRPTGGPWWLHHYLNHLWVAFFRVTVLPAQSCRAASHLLQLFPGQVEREDTVQCLFTCRYCDGKWITWTFIWSNSCKSSNEISFKSWISENSHGELKLISTYYI